MYKLANSKLYNRLLKSIAHTSKNKFSTIKNNSFVILHKPTEPLLLIIV
jgi:hypothetical protein